MAGSRNLVHFEGMGGKGASNASGVALMMQFVGVELQDLITIYNIPM